jgi:zinc transport system substrate-binding protein
MVFMRAIRGLIGIVAVVLALSGCSALAGDDTGSGPQVVAAFYPYAYVAQRVVGNHADVSNLTAPGVEPHDLELTPRQVADLSQADLVIYEQGFQPAVDEAIDQNATGTTLDVTDVVPLQDTGAPSEPGAEGADLPGDPHLWLDPTRLEAVAREVAAQMADVDPKHAAAYRTNAAALIRDLNKLDADFKAGLAHCQRTEFVSSHAAFGYLARRYGLTMIPIAGLSPDVEPSPARIAEIQDLITSHGITTVFSEVLGSKQYAETLANDLGVTAAVLDPIEGLPDESSHDTYLSLMRKNLAALREANDCS